jgi:recombination protein RecR
MSGTEIDKLINEISKLPGLGRKSAQRIALYLLKNKDKGLMSLMNSMKEANLKILNCEICKNIDSVSPCSICQNPKRDQETICVVEDVSDLWTFERMGFYKGMYFVLGGVLSAISGIGVNELNISKLSQRIEKQKIKEVILALSTTTEGQTTSHVIADKLELLNIKVTRLAQGVPIGGEVHYLDENTLSTAFRTRNKIL